MNKVLIAVTVLMIAGCATNPDKIASAYVPSTEYDGFTCQQLQDAKVQNEEDAALLYADMKTKNRVNTTAGVVGAIVFWPALIFMKGKDAESDARLSELKGRKTAIDKAMQGCYLSSSN